MKNWSRLILPLGLGCLAMVINASAMHNRLATVTVVAVTQDVSIGERLSEKQLAPVEFSYPSSHLSHHFWLWEERGSLLQHLGTPVPLLAGDLVPRQPYRNLGRNLFSIPDRFTLMGMRFNEDVIALEDRRMLIPGRSVKIQLADNPEMFGPFPIAFLEPLRGKEKNAVTATDYQLGVFVDQSDSEALRRLATGRVNNVVGLAE